jgi:uncharacterized protein with von Willebrand factor type A (vWA) domain
MIGWQFTSFQADSDSPFEKFQKIFQELLLINSGNFDDALSWLTELDRKYRFSDAKYGISDFIQDLKDKGFIKENPDQSDALSLTQKWELHIRKSSLRDIFGKLKKTGKGNHQISEMGRGESLQSETRPFEYGDLSEDIHINHSIQNAMKNHGIDSFRLDYSDLEVYEKNHESRTSTVLMIDISHSMILYGEDRITPAKKVALALAEYIKTYFREDSLDIIVFGDDAWSIELKDLPYLEVGPYHTNTVAGLSLAIDILQKKRNPNKQIFMITDGKPTCIKKGKQYYKNSWGLDRQIMNRTLNLAKQCLKKNISVTTFMIAQDPHLISFVEEFTETCRGKAFYSSLQGLGHMVFEGYKKTKSKGK